MTDKPHRARHCKFIIGERERAPAEQMSFQESDGIAPLHFGDVDAETSSISNKQPPVDR